MNKRTLGRSNIQVSEIGLGAWAIGGDAWGPQDDRDSIAALQRALDLGYTFIDTALSYGSGHSEKLVGQAIKGRRERIIISTKVPPKNELWGPPSYQGIDEEFPPDWIIKCCDQSLRNLGVDHIDVLLLHTWNMSWSHRSEWFEAIEKLKKQGKIRANGISVHDELVNQANVHIEAGRVDVVEVPYNIFQQLPAYEVFPLAQKHKVGIIARAPLQAGVLTGKFSTTTQFQKGDWRKEWTKANWLADNIAMAEKVRPIAQSAGISMVSLALKFVLANPAVSVAIPGARSPKQVEDNLAAIQGNSLTENVISALRELWKKGDVHSTYLGSS
jgi:aryl-alcohol dehydrogenase-like predicted oxidoreductase